MEQFLNKVSRFFEDYGLVGMILILISTERARKLLDMLWEIRSAEKKLKMFEAEDACESPLAQELTDVAVKAKVIKSSLYIDLYNQHKYWWLPTRHARG